MIGDHLVFPRGVYSHHGVQIDDERMVHFQGFGDGLRKTDVRIARIDDFARGVVVLIKNYARRHPPEEVVRRALQLVGLNGYSVVDANCEHLATYCLTGEWKSDQVRAIAGNLAVGVGAPIVARGALAVVGAVGTAAGAANVMSGLKVIALGGPPMLGLAGAAVAPAALAASAIGAAFPHDPNLAAIENVRRAKARQGAWLGAAGGTAAALAIVIGAGAPASGAAGMSRGLRRVGGSMSGGIVAVGLLGALGALLGAFAGVASARR